MCGFVRRDANADARVALFSLSAQRTALQRLYGTAVTTRARRHFDLVVSGDDAMAQRFFVTRKSVEDQPAMAYQGAGSPELLSDPNGLKFPHFLLSISHCPHTAGTLDFAACRTMWSRASTPELHRMVEPPSSVSPV